VVADIAGPAGNERSKLPRSSANGAREASSKPEQVAGHGRHEVIGGVSRGAAAVAVMRRASSTSLRNATDAPPDCAASHRCAAAT
jgi:hypothetical protein